MRGLEVWSIRSDAARRAVLVLIVPLIWGHFWLMRLRDAAGAAWRAGRRAWRAEGWAASGRWCRTAIAECWAQSPDRPGWRKPCP